MKPIKCKTGEIAKTYFEYLKTKHWHDLRIEFFNSTLCVGHCFFCDSKKVALHHKTYQRVGREYLGDLVEVCRKHHKAIHKHGLKLKKKYQKPKKRKKLSRKQSRKQRTKELRDRNKDIPFTTKIENGIEIKVYGPRCHIAEKRS